MSSNTENQRVNFASIKNPMKYPDFLEVQLKSFQDFLQTEVVEGQIDHRQHAAEGDADEGAGGLQPVADVLGRYHPDFPFY